MSPTFSATVLRFPMGVRSATVLEPKWMNSVYLVECVSQEYLQGLWSEIRTYCGLENMLNDERSVSDTNSTAGLFGSRRRT